MSALEQNSPGREVNIVDAYRLPHPIKQLTIFYSTHQRTQAVQHKTQSALFSAHKSIFELKNYILLFSRRRRLFNATRKKRQERDRSFLNEAAVR